MGISGNVGSSLSSEESELGSGVQIDCAMKETGDSRRYINVLVLQLILGFMCLRNSIPRITDWVLIGAIRNVLVCITPTIVNFTVIWHDESIEEVLLAKVTLVV